VRKVGVARKSVAKTRLAVKKAAKRKPRLHARPAV
jgi:hypothetical protein